MADLTRMILTGIIIEDNCEPYVDTLTGMLMLTY